MGSTSLSLGFPFFSLAIVEEFRMPQLDERDGADNSNINQTADGDDYVNYQLERRGLHSPAVRGSPRE